MKEPLLILGILLFCFSGQTQETENIDKKIDSLLIIRDSLIHIRQSYNTKIQSINSEINKLEEKKSELELAQLIKRPYYAKIKSPSRLQKGKYLSSDIIGNLKQGDSVELLDYTNRYFKVRCPSLTDAPSRIGYVRDAGFDTKDTEPFIEILKQKKVLAQHGQTKDADSIVDYYYKKGIHQLDSMAKVYEQKKLKQVKEAVLKRKQAQEERKKYLITRYGGSNAERILQNKIWIGMTKEMALESWGNPDDINRTVTAYYIHEQWVYSSQYLYFEDGILTSWQD